MSFKLFENEDDYGPIEYKRHILLSTSYKIHHHISQIKYRMGEGHGTAYYLLGGGYSMLTDDHVRMDLIYSKLKDKTKALLDSLTSVFLVFYLVILFYGSISSLTYTIETNQRLFTAWAPYVWPIKSIMTFGILLMLLQSIAIFFKDLAKVLNREI